MDSFPPPHSYLRPPPPPPPMADPHHLPPPPPPQPWYSGQFQFQPPHSHSPSPPPPSQPQWAPHPPPHPSEHMNAVPYGAPPYPAHHGYPNQYPPPQPQRPPMHPPPAYPNANQDWANVNWGQHPGWEHQAHNNGEDWGAKARAWAAARNTTENQHAVVQSQYPGQYLPTSDAHYHDGVQTTSVHSSSYQSYPGPAAPLDKQTAFHQQQPASATSGHPYYAPDGNFSYASRDGNFLDAGATFHQQDGYVNPSVHKQEVPSSYSSIPGQQDPNGQQQQTNSGGGPMLADPAQFSYGNHSVTDPSDQPLQFTPRFNPENNPQMLARYPDPAEPAKGMDSVTAMPTLQPWTTSTAPGISFPSAAPTFPSAAQLDPTTSMSPHSGQPSPMLGRAPVPNFHSTVPSLSSSIGLGSGISVHPATTFHGDVYGAPMSADRTKKSAVPNWLREEIIKKKDIIANSGTAQLNEDTQSTDEEAIDRPIGKGDQADSKSIDSPRSTEDEDEEDYEETARTAAINQEIKRVLTEVLLKVTSDLFDEIATRVLSEDDYSTEALQTAKNDPGAPGQKISPPPGASTIKAHEKAHILVKAKEPKSEDASEKSSSGAAGNVLGLVNYASDDDVDEEEIRSSDVPRSTSNDGVTTSSKKQLGGVNDKVENGHSPPESEINGGSGHDVGSPYLTNTVKKEADATTGHKKMTEHKPEVPAELFRKAKKDDSRENDTKTHDRHEIRSSLARGSVKELESVEARENSKGERHHDRHDERRQRKKGEDHHDMKEKSKEQGVKHGDKTKEADTRKRPSHHQTKESTKEVERVRKGSEKDDIHRKRERSKDERSERSKQKYAGDRSKHKRRRSSSVDSRGRNSKDNSVTSHSDNSSEEASENSRRKTHSKRRNLSPSPVRSRRRQVSRSPPPSKVSQRKHSPYSSLDRRRGRRSGSRSPVRRR